MTYQHYDTQKPLPFADNSIDLLWICLVFGGIADENLTTIVADLERILKPNGVLVLVENTSNQASSQYWSFRTVAFYEALFKTKKMNRVGSYIDVNEEISIMIGVWRRNYRLKYVLNPSRVILTKRRNKATFFKFLVETLEGF